MGINKEKRSSRIMSRLISRKYQRLSFCENDIDANNVMNCVYFISDGEYVKIGRAQFLGKRIASLQTSNARKLIPLCVCIFKTRQETEKYENIFHEYFADNIVMGERYDISESDIERAKEEIGIEMYRILN